MTLGLITSDEVVHLSRSEVLRGKVSVSDSG